MTATYDLVQQVFALSCISNFGSKKTGSAEQLQAYFAQEVAATFSNAATYAVEGWDVVWGPRIFSWASDQRWIRLLPKKLQTALAVVDNAMFVAYNPSLNTYVVAIAGTNPISLFGWFVEDFDVWRGQMVRYPFTHRDGSLIDPAADDGFKVVDARKAGDIQTQAYVSHGTAIGVHALLSMTDPGTGQTLSQYLDALPGKADATLIFTGHSLGGALSPTTALTLYPDPASSGWGAMRVLPTAGATPGNHVFQRLYNTAFPSMEAAGINAPYARWNTLHWNTYDLVPHAWNQLNQVILPGPSGWMSIFGPVSDDIGLLLAALSGYAHLSALGGVYTQLDALRFSPPDPAQWPSLTSRITTLPDFLTALVNQHVTQYVAYFGIPDVPRPESETAGGAAAGVRDLDLSALMASPRQVTAALLDHLPLSGQTDALVGRVMKGLESLIP